MKRSKKAVTTFKPVLQRDLVPFIDNSEIIKEYIEGYINNYDYQKQYLFNTHVHE